MRALILIFTLAGCVQGDVTVDRAAVVINFNSDSNPSQIGDRP